jgi:hypothetical protein
MWLKEMSDLNGTKTRERRWRKEGRRPAARRGESLARLCVGFNAIETRRARVPRVGRRDAAPPCASALLTTTDLVLAPFMSGIVSFSFLFLFILPPALASFLFLLFLFILYSFSLSFSLFFLPIHAECVGRKNKE